MPVFEYSKTRINPNRRKADFGFKNRYRLKSITIFKTKIAEMLVYQQASRVYENKHEPRPCFFTRLRPHGCLINKHE